MQLIDGETVVDGPVRPDEGNGVVPVDTPVAECKLGVETGREFVLVASEQFVHQTLLAETARCQQGIEDVIRGHDAGAAAQLFEIASRGQGNFPRLLPIDDNLHRRVSLEHLVVDTVGHIGLEPDTPAEFLGRAEARLQAQAFQVVIGHRAGPGAESDAQFREFDIARHDHPSQAVQPFISR